MSSALKGISELAYDPLGEALFAAFSLKQAGSGGFSAAIKRIPDHSIGEGAAWEHH